MRTGSRCFGDGCGRQFHGLRVGRHQNRVADMSKAMRGFGDVREGMVVKLEYVPNQRYHGVAKSRPVIRDIPGGDFFRGLMKIWLGAPADKNAEGQFAGRFSGLIGV